MLATFLKGETLEVFKTLDLEERRIYQTIKGAFRAAFRAEDFKYTDISEFHLRTMLPNERKGTCLS